MKKIAIASALLASVLLAACEPQPEPQVGTNTVADEQSYPNDMPK